jgi:hypothetical protein
MVYFLGILAVTLAAGAWGEVSTLKKRVAALEAARGTSQQ